MTMDRERFENGLLAVRFTGVNLRNRGVSIYDLSETLLGIQRILHKAYLAKNGRLEKGAFPNKDERPGLALQLGERKRSSDAFALVPILTDPAVYSSLRTLVGYVAEGMVGYVVGDLIDRVRNEKDEDKKIFVGAIYAENVNIANRIDAIGGVEGISISSPALGVDTVAAYNPSTKEYFSALRGEVYLGPRRTIKGRVYKLYPASRIVAIRRSGNKSVSIFLSEEDFEKIRYHQGTSPVFEFHGRARYKLGIETKVITEFEADSVTDLTAGEDS